MLLQDSSRYKLPIKKKLGKVADGEKDDDVATVGQLNTAVNSTLEGNNNDFTGTNTHSGTETFSHATGVTTDTITERTAAAGVTADGVLLKDATVTTGQIIPATAGAGTELKRPVVAVTTTPVSPTKWGGVYTLSKADGITVTLPALATTNIGTVLTFPILTSSTSGGYVFSPGEAGDVMIGGLWCTIANPDGANDMEFNIADGTENTLTLGATTACGLAGGCVEFIAISATQWFVRGTVLGSGTLGNALFTTV